LQDAFEEYLTDEYKTFLQILRVAEEHMSGLSGTYAGTGRRPYSYTSYLRRELAKRYFDIEKTGNLISRLKGDPNLRLLCGFQNVPDKSQFSRGFAYIAELKVMDKVLEAAVRLAYPQGSFIQHVCRDSAAVPARENVPRKEKGKVEKVSKKRGRPPKNVVKESKAPTALETQVKEDAAKSIAAIDTKCSWGLKKKQPGAH
jgi:hypothetical protein